MIYFRRIWAKILILLLTSWTVVWLFRKFLEFLAQELNQHGIVSEQLNKMDDYWLLDFKEHVGGLAILLFSILTIWFLLNLITGQLKRDYYSVQLSKHLQRQVTQNSYQMNTIEERKANYWLKRLRIIKWKGRMIVLIPCGPNAAVQNIIQKRCEQYLISWLVTNIKRSKWSIKINIHNSVHFNWLYVSEKGIYKR